MQPSSERGPLSRKELDELAALVLEEPGPVMLPKATVLRLLIMLDARDGVIRGLCANIDRLHVDVANTLKGWDAG